ncbi:MAG: hypothetical protein AB7I18_07370 [Candidatus Berkiella sp.]
MLKKSLIGLTFALGSLCASGVFAESATTPKTSEENMVHDAIDACKESKEGDNCMFLKDDTKFTGSCKKQEDKLKCVPY